MKKNLQFRPGYLPTLDGWRAIAILMVMFCHETVHGISFLNTRWFQLYGDKGVDIFFAISGILICSRLLDEESRFGHISIKHFYVRRAFRILPPALAYLLVIGLLALAGVIVVPLRQWVASAFFYRNYGRLAGVADTGVSWYTGHFWSLSVEEHFYLLLPALLLLTRRHLRVPVLLFIALAVLGNRAMQLSTRPWHMISYHTDVRMDSLLFPAILAVLLHADRNRNKARKWFAAWPFLAIIMVALFMLWHDTFTQRTILALFVPLVIMGSILAPNNLFGRFLEWRPLRFVGKISFSLYLWQQLFISRLYRFQHPLGILDTWPFDIAATFVCAVLSYYLLELPLVRIGHRFASSKIPGRPELRASDRESMVSS